MTDLERFSGAISTISNNSYGAAVETCAEIVERYLAAYSASVFPEPKPGQHGITVDACSAAALRAVLPHIIADIRRLDKR